MKNIIFIKQKYGEINWLKSHIKSVLSNDFMIETFEQEEGVLKQIVAHHHEYHKIIIINEDAIFPFMYLSKVKGIVAAAIYDERSAHMTAFHNDAKVMCLGYEISAAPLIVSMIKKYLTTEFEGTRHYARLNMLTVELEQE